MNEPIVVRRASRALSCVLTSILALAVLAAYAEATILPKQGLGDLLERADLVFYGTVAKVAYAYDDDGETWTLYTFDAMKVVAGEASTATFNVRCIGGDLDGITSHAAGTPIYARGDEVLVFYQARDEFCQISGWEQGSFRIREHKGQRILVSETGRPVTGLGARDFVYGQRLPQVAGANGPDAAIVVEGQSNASLHEPMLSSAPAADLNVVIQEIKNMAKHVRKDWKPQTPVSAIAGKVRRQ